MRIPADYMDLLAIMLDPISRHQHRNAARRSRAAKHHHLLFHATESLG